MTNNYSITDYFFAKEDSANNTIELFCKMTSSDWGTEMSVVKYSPVSEDTDTKWEAFNKEVFDTLGFLPEYDIK
jgi:hypothetical protein